MSEYERLKADLEKLVQDMGRYIKKGRAKAQKLTTLHWKDRLKEILRGRTKKDVRKELFDLMSEEHGLTLVDTELWDIITLCQKPIMSEAEFILKYTLQRAGQIDGTPDPGAIVRKAKQVYRLATT